MSEFKSIGFYICPIIAAPKVLGINSREMLSVSPCFNDIEPILEVNDYYKGWSEGENWCETEKENHKKLLQLDDSEYMELLTFVHRLCENRVLDVDGRFTNLSDAKSIFNGYFKKLNYKLVSVSTTDEYFKIFENEHSYPKEGWKLCGETDDSKLLGYDILGWDFDSFHTFLCNGLNKELQQARFNELCLLENDFSEIEKFTENIAELGEDVYWLPFRIGETV